MATIYNKNEGGKTEPNILLSKTNEIDFDKLYPNPETGGTTALIQATYSALMEPTFQINHIFSTKDYTNNDENYKLWPLVVFNSENKEKYAYRIKTSFYTSKLGQGCNWNNFNAPSNWNTFVNYMNVNGLWGKNLDYTVGLDRYRPDCFSAQLNGSWNADCWNGGGYPTNVYGEDYIMFTQLTQYQNTTAFTSSFKTKLMGAGLPLGNVNMSMGYSRPLDCQGVYFDLPDNNNKNIHLGFEGVLSSDTLDADINACTGNFYDSLIILGMKGGWVSTTATGAHYSDRKSIHSKVYSLREDNQFSIIKKKIATNKWYFCDKDMITLNGEDRLVQHYKGEIEHRDEINYSSAHGGHGVNQLVAFYNNDPGIGENALTSLEPPPNVKLGWYCGPTAVGDLVWTTTSQAMPTTALTYNADFNKYFIIDELSGWVYHKDEYKGAGSASKYKQSDGKVHITEWGSDSVSLNRQQAVFEAITSHFAGLPAQAQARPNVSFKCDVYGTPWVAYQPQQNIQYYREEYNNPSTDYTEFKDVSLFQPLFIFKSHTSNTHSFEIGAPYNISAIQTYRDGEPLYYNGSKTNFDVTKWTTNVNEATLFCGNKPEDATYAETISSTIWQRSEWPTGCGMWTLYRNGYKIYPKIFDFPAHSAGWVSMNYFIKQDP